MKRVLTLTVAALALVGGSAFAMTSFDHHGDKTKKATYEKKADIVDTAVNAGSFNTLVAAVQAAGLEETLRGDGPFTVFAPTDEAFAALPAGTVDTLLLPENKDQLVAILTYHVVPGKIKSTDLSDGQTAATVNGNELTVSLANGVSINSSNVVTADVKASNGIIHVIDAVLLPPAAE
jgi:uncharacterized surface protein with fasciclin (FAS1) repeats